MKRSRVALLVLVAVAVAVALSVGSACSVEDVGLFPKDIAQRLHESASSIKAASDVSDLVAGDRGSITGSKAWSFGFQLDEGDEEVNEELSALVRDVGAEIIERGSTDPSDAQASPDGVSVHFLRAKFETLSLELDWSRASDEEPAHVTVIVY